MQNSEQVFDELLVLNAQGGDHRAINLLVTRWDGRLKRQVYRQTGDSEAVNDITQEAWIAIIRGINTLQDVRKFGAWALSIATRKAIDFIRKNQTDRKRQEVRELVQEEMMEGNIQDEGVMRHLREGLRKLPEEQQMILSLFYLENMNVTEISLILSVPAGTVKSRLFYAREHLKSIIKKYKEDED